MNSLRKILSVVLIIVTCAACTSKKAATSPRSESSALPLTGTLEKDQVVVYVAGKLFTSYKFAPSLKKPYLWPVVGPRSGKSVTVESVPGQYPHHNSIWLGCDRVNGQNFWAPPDDLKNGQIRSLGPKIIKAEGKEIVFTDECLWQKPDAEPVIRDQRQITISAPSADLRVMDFDFTLHMLTDVTAQKTNHSLFSVRVVPELSVKSGGTLVNAEGRKGEKETFGVASPWCDYFGTREGITEGVALFQHPDNRWYPCKWFTRDYGFMSPTPMFWPPNDKEHRFARGEAIRLRYRVVVHAGNVTEAGIPALFEQYASNACMERLDQALELLQKYQFGQSREPLITITDLIRNSYHTPRLRETIEDRLVSLLQGNSTDDAKRFICERLSEFGTERSVPALAALLTDEKLSDAARFALERIPSPRCDEALRAALGRLDGNLKIGVINSIAERRDPMAVPALAEHARSSDVAIAAAAIFALGRIGGHEAANLLGNLVVSNKLIAIKADALLRCADQICAAGDKETASTIYRQMLSKGTPAQVRARALEGLVRIGAGQDAILRCLADEARPLQLAAAKLAARIPGETATAAFLSQLPSLPPDVQVALLVALAARGDKTAAPAVAKLAESPDEAVRIAAIRALGLLGDASHIMLLARAAAAGGAAGKAADESLLLLTGDGVDAAMASPTKSAEPEVRVVLIRTLVARGYNAVIPVLFDALEQYEPQVHRAACKALGTVAGRNELDRMVTLLIKAQTHSARQDLEQALVNVVTRINDAEACAAPILEALPKANEVAKASLLIILSRVGGDKALAAVSGQLGSENPIMKKAAIQSLAEWPDTAPMSRLLELARSETNEVDRALALRGYIKQVTMPAKRSFEKTVKMLREALALARRVDEKRAILSALPNYPCEDAIALAESCLKDQQVAPEAALALKMLKRTTGLRLDFQPKWSPIMEGFIEVNGSTMYDEKRGYGWAQKPPSERDRKIGTDLTRDFVTDSVSRTFRIKVPNGQHVVTVFLGDMTVEHDNMEVLAEGQIKLQKVTNKLGEVKELFFQVEVKDGLLDIEFRDGGGKNPHWACAGLIVGK